MNLTDLDTFVRVVHAGSFSAAARNLGVPKSTISRRVRRLEDALGVALLARKARSFTITPHGQQLHDRTAPAMREIHSVGTSFELADREPAGTLRLTTMSDFGSTRFFAELLNGYRARWPKVELFVELTARRVDLVAEGFDVGFRAHGGHLRDADDLMTKRMLAVAGACYASPDYVGRRGAPLRPGDLAHHDCLGLAVPDFRERFAALGVHPVLEANDFSLLLSCCLAGGGVAFLPTFHAEPYVERGELVRVVESFGAGSGYFSLVWPTSRILSPRVRAFIDHATAFFGAIEPDEH